MLDTGRLRPAGNASRKKVCTCRYDITAAYRLCSHSHCGCVLSGSASANGLKLRARVAWAPQRPPSRVQPRAVQASLAVDRPVDDGFGVLAPQARAALPAPGRTLHESGRLLAQDNGLQLPQQLLSLSDEETKT
jgi:hypothetical protein